MAIDNPSNNLPPLPRDIQARIENALNQVTMATAEANRMTKLVKEQEDTINARYIVAKSLEAQISSLTTNAEAVKDDFDRSYSKFQEIETKKIASQKELDDLTARVGSVTNELSAKQVEIVSRETEISNKEKNIQERSDALALKEEAHKKKVERLLEAIG